ncbi:hydrocephalus-inducing protein homolog [Eucyclogobius newberryi]|uniref:hydrocephalus-inducing protein homolog n=1 Tax=Eucyclogobius newberryi TaxID=166745 RepID=UPI003B598629
MIKTKVSNPQTVLKDEEKIKKLSLVDVEQALFQPYPSKIIFQNFTPGETFKLPLQLFNRDKVPRYVKLELQESEYFRVAGPEDASGKVAPGLSANYTVLFSPQDNKDYQHRLVFVTERERFEISVVAIGPRAILDFRDELLLSVCHVKATTEKTQLVRNIGNSKANFKLQTKEPFSVIPTSGSLDVGHSVQVTVTFSPLSVGDHRQDLLLYYHTGELICVSLFGACEEIDIQLESDLVLLDKTFISLSSVQTVSLTNTSHIPLRYFWTTQPRCSEQEDMPRWVHAIHHSGPLSTTAQNPLSDLSIEGAITLEPMAGEIWPNVTAEFCIIFKPVAATLYQQTLYCDITGRESPLCLTVKGEGLGPKLEPNYTVMDMKNICIGDNDWYEVTLTNKGLIDAPFKMSSPNTTFGHFFSFSPVEAVVPPGACQTVKVTFSSSVLGTFSEDLLLTVKGQPRPQTLTFRGNVNGPTFDFDVTELNFGDVAFGFPQTAICTLFNRSFVPMTFSLHVLGDGLGLPSVSCVQQVNDKSRSQWQGCTAKDRHVRPKEFTVNPESHCVPVMSEVTITVTLCSNTVKRYELALAVDVESVGEKIRTLPLIARCTVPYLEVDTPLLDYNNCFLDLPYEQKVHLVNTSSLPACYGVLEQELETNSSLHFKSLILRGVILPHSSEDLPVCVIAKAVGRLHCNMQIAVFGSTQPPLEVVLSCVGQGPIVHVQSTHLDFGRIPVLNDIVKSLILLNQSPIPAHFSVLMNSTDTLIVFASLQRQRKYFWCVEPKEGEVPGGGQLELQVVAHLKDTLHFEDELEVSVQDCGTLIVSVYGKGIGTTIVSDKPFAPNVDLGTHFSHGLYQYHFKLTNLGLRTHRMYWRTDGLLNKTQRVNKPGSQTSLPPIIPPKKKNLLLQGSRGSSRVERPVFSLNPSRVELFPGQSVDMILTGSCNTPMEVHERLVCNSIVGNTGSCDNIMTVDVTCYFVAPMLSISPKQLHFCLEKVPGKSILPQYKGLLLKNVSTLTLFMDLQTVEPFFLCQAQGSQSSATTKMMALDEGKNAELWVCLNPGFCEDRVSRVLDGFLEIKYRGHPQQDTVELHGEIHFPNLFLSSTSVDFGCVLNSTETQREITISNCSPLPVVYHWTFLDQKLSTPREARPSNEDNENTLSSVSLPPFSPVSTDNEEKSTYCPVKVEEMFDVLPIHGHLQPGELQVTAFSFYGRDYVSREVVAQCHVEDGPVYKVTLKGEASQVSFSLDHNCVDFGQKLFDHVGEAEVILKNTGKVGFNFKIWSIEQKENTENNEPSENTRKINSHHENIQQNDENVIPGQPLVFPSKGYTEAGTATILRVLYLPGVPEMFERRLQLQVACLPPHQITVIGEGVFPRVILNLPRNFSQDCHSDLVKQAKETVKTNEGCNDEHRTECATESSYTPTSEELLEMEMERFLVKENALSVIRNCLEFKEQGLLRSWSKLSKCLLPEYILDLGSVILGRKISQTVHITNNGSVTVSLTANHKVLAGTGFDIEFEKVKNLPCGETHVFIVMFDPQGAKLPLGSVCVVLPIQVKGGPTVQVHLCAVVTKPTITVSTEKLEFDTIPCGMCQMKAVQLFNPESVTCQWSIAEEVKLKKVDKFLPFYKRKQQPPPVVFEMVPNSGVLSPGERVNVQVKFTPLEEEFYSKNLVVSVAESHQKLLITAQGTGEEPKLDFSPQVLQLGPCLPFRPEVEAEVKVKNPCSFPIEFYCLELDKQYLEEEKILRSMQGYDENNRLLLPPRIPGEGLPQELLDFYQHNFSNTTDNDNDTECDAQIGQTHNFEKKRPPTALEKAEFLLSEKNREGLGKELGQLNLDPVFRANARHMGVDLSPDSLAALNRRGIAIIVYGAPNTSISSTAESLAQYYGGALLNIDAVVTEALLNGTSPAAMTARQLYEQAAAEYSKSVEDTSLLASLEVPEVLDSSYNGEPTDTEITQSTLFLGGDMASLKTLLPEHVLFDILTERFQSSDCHRGMVVNGLKSVFTASVAHTLQVVLKAFNNRKRIYVVNMFDSYSALQNRKKAQKNAEVLIHDQNHQTEEAKALATETPTNTEKLDRHKTPVNELQTEFLAFKQSQVQVEHILHHWDRVQGVLLVPLPVEEVPEEITPEKTTPVGKGKTKKSRGPKPSPTEPIEEQLNPAHVIPHLVLNLMEKDCRVLDLLLRNPLPLLEEVLDALGLGPSGPPIPLPATFSLVPFPKNRTLCQLSSECFTFLDPAEQNEQSDEREEEEDSPIRSVKLKAHTKGPGKSTIKETQPPKEKDRKVKETQKGKRRPLDKTKLTESSRNTSHTSLSSLPIEYQPKRNQRLTNFRWIAPANGEVTLRIWFFSEVPGVFEQKFNFEMAGTQIQWQLICKGTCAYPSISKDYMTLFSYSKKAPHVEVDLLKTYIINPGYFEFGPLLCGKTRDGYKESKYPDNIERLVIHNTSGIEAEINFSFQNDIQATTYLLEPPDMTLKPDEKQELMIWAYPTKLGQIKDSIVCRIKDNRKPLLIDVSCWGVRPELELDTRSLSFDKSIIHWCVSRTVNLHNKTALPVSWRLQGIDELGDFFSVPQDQGIVPPHSTCPLTLYFKAKKPLHIKKTIRIEVSDVEKIVGIVQTENISVSAEAYDASIKIEPGKNTTIIDPNIGAGGEIISTLGTNVSIQAVFSRYRITPACDINFGPLVFGGKKTMSFIIENTGVFETRYSIQPERSGLLYITFVSYKLYYVLCLTHLGSSSRLSVPGVKVKPENMQKDMNTAQTRLTMGVLSVYPCTAVVLPGSQQMINVECSGDQLGRWDQGLIIDICDRDPSDHPDGIPYRLLAEVYKIGIVSDPSSIFEEHFLCRNSNQLSSEPFVNAKSIYVTEENMFIFNKVLVGQTVKARFKLTNNTKIPCHLNLSIDESDYFILQQTPLHEDIFYLSPTSLSIPGQSHRFIEVTFTPLEMTIYHGVFEASIDGANRTTHTNKGKMLEFNVIGEGAMPSVCVIHPALKNSTGDSLLQFRRSLIGQRKTQSIVLLNDGNDPAQVRIDMPDKDGVFTLNAAKGNNCSSISTVILESSSDPEIQIQSLYRAITQLNVRETVEFEVSFCSKKAQKCNTKVYLEDSEYNNITILVTGEACEEIVSLENIKRQLLETDEIVDGNYEVMDFGDCHVDVTYQESFTMVNHSKDKVLRFEWPPAGPQVRFLPQVGHLHAGCSKEVVVSFHSTQPISLSSKSLKCKVTQVVFKEPLEQVLDWDDQQNAPSAPPQPAKKKVIKTDSEPSCSVVEGWNLSLELRINAVCDYAKFNTGTHTINFKDTMLYQTRLQKLQISNEGQVGLAFSWKVQIDHGQTDENLTSLPSFGSSNAVTRPSSGTESVVSLLSINPELVPFTVEPCIGTIKPRATQEFKVHFSPLEVSQFEGILICSIPNLQAKDQSPSVSVSGGSIMPSCHFDFEDSNYISGSHNPEFRSPLEPKTRVVEFIAVGLSALSTRRFFVLNPTNKPYSFKWRCEDSTGSSFRCLTQSGFLQPKEKAEVHLEYVSEQMDIVESSWSFVIDTLSVSVPFLFVGTTREPHIYLDKALINFGDLLVGNKAEQTVNLVNTEEEPFHFSVLQSSLLSEDQLSSLIIQPMSSSLGPKGRCSLAISFAPNRQGYFSFRVFLKVKRRLEPLALTVKADCVSLGTLVEVEKPCGGLRELRPNHIDSIDFERVGISEQSSFRFLISNLARCELNITFNVAGPRNLVQHLKAKPKHATVEVGKQLQLSLSFCPLSVCNLQDIRLSIKVKDGATFTLDVKGKGTAPCLEFSFTKHNFGKCFVHSSGMLSPTQTLVIRNKDKRDISIQCLFENTSYLEIGFQPSILASGADLKIPITFSPQETHSYQEKLNFILNSCVTRQVEILGQGIELKLEVEDQKHKRINFGSLKPGTKSIKRIVLVNHSTVRLCFSLLLNSNTPLDPKDLSVSPTRQLNLKAGESCTAEIQFYPRQHVPKFTVELQAETLGLLHPLLSIRGSCQGIDVHLDQIHLAFGAVVQHGQTSRKIVMINTGDIGGKFCWKTEKFPSSLCISPTKGFIDPGMEVPFEVVFAPVQLSNESRFENLPCILEGCSSPLTLTVTGSCVMAPVKEVMNFVCPVRNSHTQSLSVVNPTNQSCTIRPVIEGEQWTGAPAIILEPFQNKMFEIKYCPFTMTSERNKHLGSLFFSFPDGTGLCYSFEGTAEAPKAENTIVYELQAKTHHKALLSVENWLLKPQRFRVLLEIVRPDKLDATVSFSGLEFIDVPALTKQDYNLSFFTYKTGTYNTKVTFCNEASGEYLFYLVTFKATSYEVQSTLELETAVRQPVSATVHITNPLATNVRFNTECKCSDISVPPQHTVPGHSKAPLSFGYLPLIVGETTARLTLSSNELGYFYYDLILKALPPAMEKSVHFTASLGNSHSVNVKFTNFSRTKTDFSCKTDYPDFLIDKSVTGVAGFQEASVVVCFEPLQLGEVSALLTLSSAAGGEYTFPLHGVCQPPKPQGPYSISMGKPLAIAFRNVFLQTTAFSYQVNNPAFKVKAQDVIVTKKSANVLVSLDPPPKGGPGPWFGKLTISSKPSEVHTKPYSWVFFLKGCRTPSS